MTTPYNLSAWRTVKIEPVTLRLPDGCSYHLSYWRLYRARRHVDPCVDPLTRATLAHSYNFCGNCLVYNYYSSVKSLARYSSQSFEKTQTIYISNRASRSGIVWNDFWERLDQPWGRYSQKSGIFFPLEMNGKSQKLHIFVASTQSQTNSRHSVKLSPTDTVQTLKRAQKCCLPYIISECS